MSHLLVSLNRHSLNSCLCCLHSQPWQRQRSTPSIRNCLLIYHLFRHLKLSSSKTEPRSPRARDKSFPISTRARLLSTSSRPPSVSFTFISGNFVTPKNAEKAFAETDGFGRSGMFKFWRSEINLECSYRPPRYGQAHPRWPLRHHFK